MALQILPRQMGPRRAEGRYDEDFEEVHRSKGSEAMTLAIKPQNVLK
jgi:hypothetical protein